MRKGWRGEWAWIDYGGWREYAAVYGTQHERAGRTKAVVVARRGARGSVDAPRGIGGAFTRGLTRGGEVGEGGIAAGGATSPKPADTAAHLSGGGSEVLATLRTRDG